MRTPEAYTAHTYASLTPLPCAPTGPHLSYICITRSQPAHMKVLRRKVALEIHRSKIFLWAYPAELINADSTSQTNKAITGWKKSSVAWGIGV